MGIRKNIKIPSNAFAENYDDPAKVIEGLGNKARS